MVGFLSYFWIPKPSRFLCLQVFYAFELVLSIFELKKIVHLYHIPYNWKAQLCQRKDHPKSILHFVKNYYSLSQVAQTQR
jgi:hypothetical protein